MKKIIGVDIDGVMTDENKNNRNIWQSRMENYLGRKITREKDVFNLREAFNLSREELEGFMDRHLADIYKTVDPARGARQTLKKLREDQYKIIFITARKEKYREITVNWLNRHKIPHDRLYHEDDKAPLARKLGISLFIEDNKDNALQLLNNDIFVLLVNKYYNRDLGSFDNLYRVNDWQEIKKKILDLTDRRSAAM